MVMAEVKQHVVNIEMKDGKVIKAELYPEVAPNTVNNFEKKYNSLISEKNPVKLEQLIRKTQKPKQQENPETE